VKLEPDEKKKKKFYPQLSHNLKSIVGCIAAIFDGLEEEVFLWAISLLNILHQAS
jgi:hypothetical protein